MVIFSRYSVRCKFRSKYEMRVHKFGIEINRQSNKYLSKANRKRVIKQK